VHAPPAHAEETQAVGFVQAPLVEHVSTLFPEQRMAFGAHTPVQLPLTQAWLEHAVAFCHVPVESQVCGC
jgi:hypothetical protein